MLDKLLNALPVRLKSLSVCFRPVVYDASIPSRVPIGINIVYFMALYPRKECLKFILSEHQQP